MSDREKSPPDSSTDRIPWMQHGRKKEEIWSSNRRKKKDNDTHQANNKRQRQCECVCVRGLKCFAMSLKAFRDRYVTTAHSHDENYKEGWKEKSVGAVC